MKRSSIVVVANASLLALCLTGCAPWATYPPVESKMAQSMSRETFEPVPTVMAVALQYAREHYANNLEVAINLPEGTPAAAYDKVIKKLGWGHPMTLPTEEALHVSEVRTRGFNAQADVIFRRADGLNQMATITMSRGALDKYKVTDTRLWQLRDQTSPSPNYIPPPPKRDKSAKPGTDSTTAQ